MEQSQGFRLFKMAKNKKLKDIVRCTNMEIDPLNQAWAAFYDSRAAHNFFIWWSATLEKKYQVNQIFINHGCDYICQYNQESIIISIRTYTNCRN